MNKRIFISVYIYRYRVNVNYPHHTRTHTHSDTVRRMEKSLSLQDQPCMEGWVVPPRQ